MNACGKVEALVKDAELAVMSIILCPFGRPEEILDAVLQVPEDSWTNEDHRRIWQTARALRNAGEVVCETTIYWELRGEPIDFVNLSAPAPPTSAYSYLRIIDEARRGRQARYAWMEGSKRLLEGEDASEVISGVERDLVGFTEDPTWETSVRTNAQALEELKEGGSRGEYGTGIEEFDRLLGRLRLGAVYVLVAGTSEGKTLVATQIARNIAKAGGRVSYYSTEMTQADLMARVVASEAEVTTGAIERRAMRLDDPDMSLDQAERLLASWTYWSEHERLRLVYRAGMRASEIVAREQERARRRGPPNLLVIDYLQRLQGESEDRAAGRYAQILRMSGIVKDGSISLNCPILLLVQPSRKWLDAGCEMPRTHDLAESGRIEQDADAVVSLAIPHNRTNDPVHQGKMLGAVIKQRRGPLGRFWLSADLEYQRVGPLRREEWPASGLTTEKKRPPARKNYTGTGD